MMTEEWKWVVGLEGRYEVSSLGNVRSWRSSGAGRSRQSKMLESPKPIKPCLDPRGYYNFTVWFPFEYRRVYYIHREAAKAFLPNTEGHPLVRHLNDIKTDNRIENLSWGTYKQNRQDGIKNGTQFHSKGVRPVQAKLTEKQVVKILLSQDNNCVEAKKYIVTESTINKIRKGHTWKRVSQKLKQTKQ